MSVESPITGQLVEPDDLHPVSTDEVASSDESAWSSPSGAFHVVSDLARRLSRTNDFESGVLSALIVLKRYLLALQVELEVPTGNDRRTLRAVDAPDETLFPQRGGLGAIESEPVRISFPLVAVDQTVGRLEVTLPAPPTLEAQNVLAVAASMLAATVMQASRIYALEHEVVARVRQVAEQRRFIERVVDSFPAGLYVVDRDYRIHAWNRKRETGLQGVSRDEAIGRTIFEVLHRQPAALLKREFDEVFATGRLQQFEMESTATGDVRTFRISKIPMRLDDDLVTHVITIGEDITEWKAAIDRTAQSEKLAALGQLAAGVMHEINNPLATIAACAESLSLMPSVIQERDGAPMVPPRTGSPPSELLRIIDLEVHRCKRIVNGLLDFARPKPATRQPVNINTVVRHAVFLLQHHPQYKQVKVIAELEESDTLMALGDADQLVQVTLALTINALDATPAGGRIIIRTRAEHDSANRALAILEVADEGAGIPRAYHSKVFEPFFTTKGQGQGTGLGLAISYGIVSDHGGVLELIHTESPGATFRVSVPMLTTA